MSSNLSNLESLNNLDVRYQQIHQQAAQFGQEHLLTFWSQLDDSQREQLLGELESLDFAYLDKLIKQIVLTEQGTEPPGDISPAPCYPASPGPQEQQLYQQARQLGRQLLTEGKVAAFTVAGGSGTRLGFDGPKGAFPISPVKHKSLFQLFAQEIGYCHKHYNKNLRWYIMTSQTNDRPTRQFFKEHEYFGLPADQVVFFTQGMMPAFSSQGKILLDRKDRLALSPDGHGGSLRALKNSGALAEMARLGIEYISYFQVDNPLARCLDPLFVGLGEQTGSEMSSKVVPKLEDLEKVGNMVVAGGKVCVIEYSDMPEELARAKNPNGSRKFDAGSIAIHIISRAFVQRITKGQLQLPFHRAVKKVPYVDQAGRQIEPSEPNAIKLEQFIFDAIPLASNPLVLHTVRSEEFSPVKNAQGPDSPATTREDLIERAGRWLEAAGLTVPRKDDGKCDCVLEISPAKAVAAQDLVGKISPTLQISPRSDLYVE